MPAKRCLPRIAPSAVGAAPPTGPREAGSAYIVALLALIVLTLVGLALALITQTEMQIGANERTIQRVLYHADSGIAAATAKALVTGDYGGVIFTVPESPGFESEITTTRLHPILDGPCNFCSINQGSEFFQINHAVGATAFRGGLAGLADPIPQAEKTVATMVEVQPWERSIAAANATPEELEKIHF